MTDVRPFGTVRVGVLATTRASGCAPMLCSSDETPPGPPDIIHIMHERRKSGGALSFQTRGSIRQSHHAVLCRGLQWLSILLNA